MIVGNKTTLMQWYYVSQVRDNCVHTGYDFIARKVHALSPCTKPHNLGNLDDCSIPDLVFVIGQQKTFLSKIRLKGS